MVLGLKPDEVPASWMGSAPLVFFESLGQAGGVPARGCLSGCMEPAGRGFRAMAPQTPRITRRRPRAVQSMCSPVGCEDAELYRDRMHTRGRPDGTLHWEPVHGDGGRSDRDKARRQIGLAATACRY